MWAPFFTFLSPLAVPTKHLKVELLGIAVLLKPEVEISSMLATQYIPSVLCPVIINVIKSQKFNFLSSTACASWRVAAIVNERIIFCFVSVIP
jgi:hypothetical protein